MSPIKELRQSLGMTQAAFSEMLHIPMRTIQDWEGGKRQPPPYVVELIEYRLEGEKKSGD